MAEEHKPNNAAAQAVPAERPGARPAAPGDEQQQSSVPQSAADKTTPPAPTMPRAITAAQAAQPAPPRVAARETPQTISYKELAAAVGQQSILVIVNSLVTINSLLAKIREASAPDNPAGGAVPEAKSASAAQTDKQAAIERLELADEIRAHYDSYRKWAMACWLLYQASAYLLLLVLLSGALVLSLSYFRHNQHQSDILICLAGTGVFLLAIRIGAQLKQRWRSYLETQGQLEQLLIDLSGPTMPGDGIRRQLTERLAAHRERMLKLRL